MVEQAARDRLGPYMLTKPLARGVLGPRVLALHEDDLSSHVIHFFEGGESANDPLWPGRCLAAIKASRRLKQSHVLEIEAVDVTPEGRVWVATAFTGDNDGLVPLDQLLKHKGGFLPLEEAKRAIEQLAEAVCAAHQIGLSHGELSMREVQVDRRGSLLIEHYGIARLLSNDLRPLREVQAAEVRSVLTIGYQLATGLRYEAPMIPASRVLLDVHQTWDDLFETGLGPVGFTSAAHAHSAIRGCRVLGPSAGRRVTSALRSLLPV